tara:strand:+ start:2035 stop:2694 length:660 start_codon:yes stop_codon:yes gene_type:complete
MSQLIFKFPFKTKYFEEDYYVSSSNFAAYKLIESWPKWPDKWVNIYGPKGCGKTHLSNILKKKINLVKILNANQINNDIISEIQKLDCLVIENYDKNIEENLFYSTLNHLKQLNTYVVINSELSLKNMKFKLKDLSSRTKNFVSLGIDLPTDELLRVIISKHFSEKQIDLGTNVSEYIINNIERSYEKIDKFIKEIDDLSLSSGKSININLIKKVLKNE